MTAAGKFADEAEALGWEVERIRLYDDDLDRAPVRVVIATRNDEETYELRWVRNERGNMVFASGTYRSARERTPRRNVRAVLREMALSPAIEGNGRLPFDADHDDDRTVLAAVAGKTVFWRNSISGIEQHDDCPRGGKHLSLSPYINAVDGTNVARNRALNFPGSHGFHSVRLSAITKVK